MEPRSRLACALVTASLSGATLACSETSPIGSENSAQPSSGPAVLVSIDLSSPEGRHTYAGAYPELPTTDVDPAQMLELGDSASVLTAEGFVYAWEGEQAAYTRYSVDADLRFIEGPRLSFSRFGVTGPALTHFVVSADGVEKAFETQGEIAAIGRIR